MSLRRLARDNPLPVALFAEAMLIPLALALALLLGQAPWADFHWPPGTLLLVVAYTVPLVALLGLFSTLGPDWFRGLEQLVRPAVDVLFRGRGRTPVILAALLAGFGEELLFRGVLQAWLADGLGPWIGLLLASIVFGFLHAVSPAYFVVATVMGLYLGAVYQFTDNLVLASLVHALYDWVAIEVVLRRIKAAGREDEDPAR